MDDARKKLEQDPLDFIDRDEISLYVCEQDINPDSIVEGEDYMVSHIVEPEDLAEAGLQEEM